MSLVFRAILAFALLGFAAAGCASDGAPSAGSTTPAGKATIVVSATTSAPVTAPTGTSPDTWLLTTHGIGPYRLGERVDSMPPGIFTASTPIDSANCPDLYARQATGKYAGVLLFVVRHNYLVQIESAGGDPGVHSAEGDRVGQPWSEIEGRHPTGTWHTGPGGGRAFIVPVGDRVMMFSVNPIRPDSVGAYTVGMADHTKNTFLSGKNC